MKQKELNKSTIFYIKTQKKLVTLTSISAGFLRYQEYKKEESNRTQGFCVAGELMKASKKDFPELYL